MTEMLKRSAATLERAERESQCELRVHEETLYDGASPSVLRYFDHELRAKVRTNVWDRVRRCAAAPAAVEVVLLQLRGDEWRPVAYWSWNTKGPEPRGEVPRSWPEPPGHCGGSNALATLPVADEEDGPHDDGP